VSAARWLKTDPELRGSFEELDERYTAWRDSSLRSPEPREGSREPEQGSSEAEGEAEQEGIGALLLTGDFVPLGLWNPEAPLPGDLTLRDLILAIRRYHIARDYQRVAGTFPAARLATETALEELGLINRLILAFQGEDPALATSKRFLLLSIGAQLETARQRDLLHDIDIATARLAAVGYKLNIDLSRRAADVETKRRLNYQGLILLGVMQRQLFRLLPQGELPELFKTVLELLQKEHARRVEEFNTLYRSEEAPTWQDLGITPDENEQPLRWYWDRLSTSSGVIKIIGPTGEVDEETEFPMQIRAMFARLLAIPLGRRLLRRMRTSKGTPIL
jgi:hypothetical protein